MAPIRLRLMTGDVSGIALWGAGGRHPEESHLPIDSALAVRVRAWVDEYTDSIGWLGCTQDWSLDHDRRGYVLSLELEAALGPDYDLLYVPETAAA